jgi:soluble lytic murein transglycosylase-like protein
MLFSSGAACSESLGIRRGADRRRDDRRAQRRGSPERRRGDRRRARVGSFLLLTAAVVFPQQPAPDALNVWLHAPVPIVTTSIQSMVGVPAAHAYDSIIEEASIRFRVDSALIRSVMQTESAFDALAVSRAGAMGLMQLMPAVAVELGVDDPFDPRQNVMAGTKYLRQLLTQYRGSLPLVLAGYNAGTAVVDQYGGVPPFPETQNYVKRVTSLVANARRAGTE